MRKSSVDEIRRRFDEDVERFSNLETGQSATMDAALAMQLITQAAACTTPAARDLLDIGCGAGNYTLKLLELLPHLNVTLVDLSRPMLERAAQRIGPLTTGMVTSHQVDIREFSPLGESYDIILAAAVLHHLRGEDEWRSVFRKLYQMLRSGGSCWIFDLVESSIPPVQALMWQQYGAYLADFKGEEYRDQVFAYIAREDTPRDLLFQIDLLREVGFQAAEVLHKQSCFAAFGAVK
ncbi:MAG: class I SAM-dependent methyltransferase [Planctomycetaceae bacterium]|nr:class I SAM-dependent methyltransferase [Planctomycetaceae bacterium]